MKSKLEQILDTFKLASVSTLLFFSALAQGYSRDLTGNVVRGNAVYASSSSQRNNSNFTLYGQIGPIEVQKNGGGKYHLKYNPVNSHKPNIKGRVTIGGNDIDIVYDKDQIDKKNAVEQKKAEDLKKRLEKKKIAEERNNAIIEQRTKLKLDPVGAKKEAIINYLEKTYGSTPLNVEKERQAIFDYLTKVHGLRVSTFQKFGNVESDLAIMLGSNNLKYIPVDLVSPKHMSSVRNDYISNGDEPILLPVGEPLRGYFTFLDTVLSKLD